MITKLNRFTASADEPNAWALISSALTHFRYFPVFPWSWFLVERFRIHSVKQKVTTKATQSN